VVSAVVSVVVAAVLAAVFGCGRGTTSVVPHFGQTPCLPAASSPIRMDAVQYGQSNSIAIPGSWVESTLRNQALG
jgi:hypothetical protein